MRYIQFTHVDAMTGIPCTTEPMANGPAFPAVKGLAFVWDRASEYPTSRPSLYGTCDDDADLQVPGVLAEMQAHEFEQARQQERENYRRRWVPQSVLMGQCRLALFDLHGIVSDEQFLGLADVLPEADRPRAVLELRTRATVRRDNPLVQTICRTKGWDADELFVYASQQ